MKIGTYGLIVLILSIPSFCRNQKSTSDSLGLGKQTELLVESTEKYLDTKKQKKNTELEALASQVFTKIDFASDLHLPMAGTKGGTILNKEKVIEIKISQNDAPCADSNIANIKLLNAYHQHHAPNFTSPIVEDKKGDGSNPGRVKARPFTELAMLS